MKANVIEKIMYDLTTCDYGDGLIMINAEGRTFTYNPHEGGDEWRVDEDDNILFLSNPTGSHWLDCDCVTSIEI